MYQAFLRLGYDVDLIAGTSSERFEQYKQIIARKKCYDFCYFEASSYPVHPIVDYRILLGLRHWGIPIGIYYRDAYWMFPEYFPYKGIKRLELIFRYRLDLLLFAKTASIMFFPTASLANLFKLKVCKAILPPGGEYKPVNRSIKANMHPLRAIYVGGVSWRYGTHLMLEALRIVNQKEVLISLDIVCRKNELDVLPQQTKALLHEPWIRVHHIAGSALQDLYSKCHIGLIPLLKDAYNDLALPVKLFEYLSFGLAVLATNCEEMRKFIELCGCGLVCEDDAQSMAEALRLLVYHPDLLRQLSERAVQVILDGNLWEDRAKVVANTLKSP
jgi:glycosyltransferase involved in cell wall biosynthesis